jgi:phospholipid transport system substrate-binding protein
MIFKSVKIKNFALLAFLASLLAFGQAMGQGVAADTPLEQVRQTVDQILNILNDKQLAQTDRREERQQRIMANIRERFDFREMSKLTLARHWRQLSQEEQDRFADLFANLLRKTYIGRVESYYHEEVKVFFRGQKIRDHKAVVSSVVVSDNKETPIDYRLRNRDGKWLVYDVVIEGVSLVRNYRTQFDRILEKEKFAGLIERMKEKINASEKS